jgi:ketosteroid isomerase-like protein
MAEDSERRGGRIGAAGSAPKRIVREMIDCYNRKALGELLAHYDPDVRFWHTMLDGEVDGLQRFGEVMDWIFTQYPDEIVTMDVLIGDDDYVVGEFRSEGTYASGGSFRFESTEVYRLVHGLIAELDVYFDPGRIPADQQPAPAVTTRPKGGSTSASHGLIPRSIAGRLLEELRRRYNAGDVDGTLALIAPDADVRFLGRPDARGIEALRLFIGGRHEALANLDCRYDAVIDDGAQTCTLWNEQGTTATGGAWSNHGVFAARAGCGRIVSLHVSSAIAPFS